MKASANTGKNTVFVISPIGEPDTLTRKRSDKILDYFIKPLCEEFGYEVIRADKISSQGIITHQVIEHILNDAFVFADLTDHNPNVFYELAICHAFQRPVIQIIEKEQSIPFDIASMRVVKLDESDIKSVEEAKATIRKIIKSIKEDPEGVSIESPISVVAELSRLRSEGKQEFANMLSNITQLSEEFSGTREALFTTLYRATRDEDSRFHYLQRKLAELLPVEYTGLICPVCGRLLEAQEPSISMKHPVCADCMIGRTTDVIDQLKNEHPEFLPHLDEYIRAANTYLGKRKKKPQRN